MNATGAGNLQWAYTLLDGLAAAGVDSLVISPGSRCTPLVLAGELHPSLRTWVQVDERCAAFFALGMARITAAPVALIATSGSAPAHWYPAVIEADQAGIPLVLLSADRPLELQDCGANQTIDQGRLFQQAVRAFHAVPAMHQHKDGQAFLHSLATRAVHQSRWPLPGPVHINVPFQEPLLAEPIPQLTPVACGAAVEPPTLIPPDAQLDRIAERIAGQAGLIVCGLGRFTADFAPSLVRLAEMLNCPVLADPLSGLRFGGHERSRILCHYDAFLRRTAFIENHRPEWVLRFGSMPVSRSLLHYLHALQAGKLILVDPFGRWPDPLHRTGEMLRATPHVVCDGLAARVSSAAPASWWEAFRRQEQRAVQLSHDLTNSEPWFEAQLVPALLDALPAGSILFTGNSMPVRELDSFSSSHEKPLQLIANRGASGIDGHVSSLLGLASAAAESTTVAGLIGDLAFYHDMNGLLAARDCNATLIVINNGGGGIFRYLPQTGLETFERYWSTPTGLDFRHAADLYRLPFRRVSSADEFEQALKDNLAQPGVKIIEAVIDPQQSVERHRAYWEAVCKN
ncbi:MAG: 2-succinyl-5-enolpyruvyl-6-hydroxy-3-cyclohexene-1-carboxylic-acid synthase [Pseudomonadota bacterium]|nr:2-succinyl-5-enolpyruvyl-6-hydroxy-3-cyclohexene-1-carboxylic-acid synthase [Pseudomonadota bacterium]